MGERINKALAKVEEKKKKRAARCAQVRVAQNRNIKKITENIKWR